MKKIVRIILLFISINITSFIISPKVEAQPVSFQVFYDDLSPYGSWIESPAYGYVWCPRASGFAPYSTNGYWVLTDIGWTWVSDYSWGWAPFHYGRWYHDPIYGYVWVPGYEWGPGWVTWRRSDNYYGWAPIGPGVNISVAYSSGYNIPYNNWNFVRCNDFGRRDIHNYYIDRSKNVTIINNTTVINTTKVDNTRKTTFTPGPDRMEVQKKIGRTINPVAIVDENKPTQRVTKNSVQLYRPVVENNTERKAIPAKVTARDESKGTINNNNNTGVRPQRKAQQVKTENNIPVTDKKQEIKQSPPVKQQPIQVPVKDNNTAPVKQQPVREQPERRREDQPQPVKQQRVQQQPVERPVQQPDKQRNIDQPPVREQKVVPQQNMNRPPERQMPVHQQPVRQAPPMQRPPVRDKKGGQ